MSRPYAGNPLEPDMTVSLYVARDTMQPRYWRLYWSEPGSYVTVGNEGETSAIYHRTMADAIAWGERHLNERAKRAYWSY